MAQNIMQGTRFEDHGTRSEVEGIAAAGGVSMAPGGGLGAAGGPMVAPGAPSSLGVPSPVDALQSMPTDAAPITAGLSLGPGPSPALGQVAAEARQLSYEQRLVALATMAKSPHLRQQATTALKALIAKKSRSAGGQ